MNNPVGLSRGPHATWIVRGRALSNPAESQTYQLDVLGRITYNSRVGSYTYDASRPHAPSSVAGNPYTYDANGNLVSGGGRTPQWNAYNKPTAINGTQFLYDGLGERVKKTSTQGTSLYPFGDDYEVTNGVVTKYVSVAGLGVVAKRVGSQTYWMHTDRLGSIQAITNDAGAQVWRKTYRPYGETITESTGHQESRGWIDQRQDNETGLTYLHARYYDPALGVFLSPDPLHPSTPGVGWNRYAYAFGDPVNGTDRSGLMLANWICQNFGAAWQWPGFCLSESVEVSGSAPDLPFDRPDPFKEDPFPGDGRGDGRDDGDDGDDGNDDGDDGACAQGVASCEPDPEPEPEKPPKPKCPGLAGKVNNAPNTAAGLVWAATSVAARTPATPSSVASLALFAANFVRSGRVGNNAIQFYGVLLPRVGGMTLGNVMLFPGDSAAPETVSHEQNHTYQGEQMGLAYLPAHAALGGWEVLKSGNSDNWWKSPLEQGLDAGPVCEP